LLFLLFFSHCGFFISSGGGYVRCELDNGGWGRTTAPVVARKAPIYTASNDSAMHAGADAEASDHIDGHGGPTSRLRHCHAGPGFKQAGDALRP
jgi:hypothetical protein